MDSYGDWYFRYRSSNAAFHSLTTQSNSAHNVFLDLGATGGIPLFTIYIVLIVYVLRRGIIAFRSDETVNPFFLAIFVAWVGYVAQSTISINNLGLAVWGWGLSGAIVGYSFRNRDLLVKNGNSRRSKIRKNLNGENIIASVLSLIVASVLVMPAFLADHKYRMAMQARSAPLLIESTLRYPISVGRLIQASQTLLSNNLTEQGLQLANKAVSINPDAYNAWMLISASTPPESKEHQKAIIELRRLNPKVTNIK
jgi:hypothetical protein